MPGASMSVGLIGCFVCWLRPGEPTPWEILSKTFKQGGDRELLGWFYSLQPENVFLKRAAQSEIEMSFVGVF